MEAESVMGFDADDVVTRVKRTAGRTLMDKAIVVVIDRNQVHTLNKTGTVLWNACEGKTVAELAALLESRYGVSPGRAEQDVRAFLAELVQLGALEVRGA